MNTLKSIGLSALGACFLIGCSSKTEEVTEQPAPKVADSYRVAINRDLVVLKRDEGRGGAAMRQPGWEHYLANDTDNINYKLPNKNAGGFPPLNTDPVTHALSTNLSNSSSGKAYSYYELSRWHRYCNNGEGMDGNDWKFIHTEGESNVPSELIENCTPPSFTYAEYISAWDAYCQTNATDLTSGQRNIIKQSKVPVHLRRSACTIKFNPKILKK